MTASLPDTMLACVYEAPQKLALERRPLPALGPGDVLIEVSHCGICGTDLHLVIEGWGRPGSIAGHEYSGVVVAVGSAVGGFVAGDRVVGGPEPGCGGCAYCREGLTNLCAGRGEMGVVDFQGAFAEYKAVAASQLLRVPDAVSLREAALCEPLAVAMHGVTRSGIAPGQRALVTGLGPIGALVVAVLAAAGVDDIVVSEPSELRRALALRLGAREANHPDSLSVPAMPFALVDEPFHCVFECSGRREAVEAGLGQLRKRGRLVLLGTGMQRHRIDGNRMILNELTLLGSVNYDEDGLARALELLASKALPAALLIEAEDVGLDGVMQAMERLLAGRLAGKVLVAPCRRASRGN